QLLHVDFQWTPVLCSTQIPCRSWLASEEAIRAGIIVDYKSAFAGKPASTACCVDHKTLA
ncbi:hypothetical protein BZ163_07155, partial [Pseudomonas sp. VI4.1]